MASAIPLNTILNMKIKNLLLALFVALPFLTYAGEIFGTLKKDGKPVVKQEIKILQQGKVIATTVTDEKGYYSVDVKPVGKLQLQVTGFEGAIYDVFSTNNSSDYTLSLVKSGDKWELKKQ